MGNKLRGKNNGKQTRSVQWPYIFICEIIQKRPQQSCHGQLEFKLTHISYNTYKSLTTHGIEFSEPEMGNHTKNFSLCAWAGKSECLCLVPACIHPNQEFSTSFIYSLHWGFARNVFFPVLGKDLFSSYLVCFKMDSPAKKV